MKRCCKCGHTKPLSEFHKRRASADGLCPLCKPCTREQNNAVYAAKSKEDVRLISLKRFGLTTAAYRAMLAAQNGGCAICGGTKKLSVDHCHKSGAIRGILCNKCNLAIGHFDDDEERLSRAIEYLKRK